MVTPFLQLILSLALIILAAKISGYLSYRLNQPVVLGELLVGILIGPSILDLLHLPIFTDTHLPEVVHELAELGALLLMFLAGLSLHLGDMLRSIKISVLSGSLGVVIPLLLGFGSGRLFGMDIQEAIFLGLILSATSVSISAQVLMEMKQLLSRVGISLMGAAVFDDVLVVLGLAIFISLTQQNMVGGFGSVVLVVLQMLAYLGVSIAVGLWFLPKLSRWARNMPVSQSLVSFAFITMILYGWSAEVIGSMAAITGAFLSGVFFSRTGDKEKIERGIGIIAYSVFVPIFFVDIGLTANIRQLDPQNLTLLLLIIVVAILGKVLGSGIGGLMGGFNPVESLQLGVGMVSRGEVGLIVASVGVQQGVISSDIFSIAVAMVLVTTVITPPMLRYVFTLNPKQKKPDVKTDHPDLVSPVSDHGGE